METSPIFNGTALRIVEKLKETGKQQESLATVFSNIGTPGFVEEYKAAKRRRGIPEDPAADALELSPEMLTHQMTENRIEYTALVKIMSAYISIFRKVATQGKQ